MQSCDKYMAIMKRLLAVLLSLLTTFQHPCAEEFYITSFASQPCPAQPCLTLTQFSTYDVTSSNVTLKFFPGNHTLDAVLNMSYLDSFVGVSYSFLSNVSVTITCKKSVGLHYHAINNILMRGIKLVGCKELQFESVTMLTLENVQHSSIKRLNLFQTTAKILKSSFNYNGLNNYFNVSSGGAITAYRSNVSISGSSFEGNSADQGGAIFVDSETNIIITNSTFTRNQGIWGGVLFSGCNCNIKVVSTVFIDNKATNEEYESRVDFANGGVFYLNRTTLVTINNSSFIRNTASGSGGVIHGYKTNVTISSSLFVNNTVAVNGGVLYGEDADAEVTITNSLFKDNSAAGNGGVLYGNEIMLTISNSAFRGNAAIGSGGVIYGNNILVVLNNTVLGNENNAYFGGTVFTTDSKLRAHNLVQQNNIARVGVMYFTRSTALFTGYTEFSDNIGSLIFILSTVSFTDFTLVTNCSSLGLTSLVDDTGGAITGIASIISFNKTVNILHNSAVRGGGIFMFDSTFYVNGETTMANNMAIYSGGALFLYLSELVCISNCTLKQHNNTASDKGGGTYAVSSTIIVDQRTPSIFQFTENEATKGGGVYFETNSLLVIRSEDFNITYTLMNFSLNYAEYGGALYVADSTYSNYSSFVQVVLTKERSNFLDSTVNKSNVLLFNQNNAMIAGSIQFGGFSTNLDVNPFPGVHALNVLNISNAEVNEISSFPVLICFCRSANQDCSYQPSPIQVMKGEKFALSIVAVDQVNHPVNASVTVSLDIEARVGESQLTQMTTHSCTDLIYNVYSPHSLEILTLYLGDPAENALTKHNIKSFRRVEVHFLPCSCPIGFQESVEEATCNCICDAALMPYIADCNPQTHTIVKATNVWIAYINLTSSGYVIFPHCPHGYCLPASTKQEIDLNSLIGTDRQCESNRTGLLCGSCGSGTSLSLGSSRCLHCPSHWPGLCVAISIAAFLAGIILFIVLMLLNLTVAAGTINGLIFYANIIEVLSSFLPFNEPTFATIFIAWLNLDIGFDACYYDGLDAYTKTLLELLFPTYIIMLVVVLIIVAKYSHRFRYLIKRKFNFLPTLATLILFSYLKLLKTAIKAISFVIITYPDGSKVVRWLHDATISYLSGKHIGMFIIAMFILVIGSVCTLILTTWDLILRKCTCLHKYNHLRIRIFLECYSAPYTRKFHFWTGMLLMMRIVLYLTSVMNSGFGGDPRTEALSVNIAITFLVILKTILGGRLYRKLILDVLEMVHYTNLITTAALMLYTFNDDERTSVAVAYISVSITFLSFLATILTTFLYQIFDKRIIIMYRRYKKKRVEAQYSNSNEDDVILAEITRFDQHREPLLYSLSDDSGQEGSSAISNISGDTFPCSSVSKEQQSSNQLLNLSERSESPEDHEPDSVLPLQISKSPGQEQFPPTEPLLAQFEVPDSTTIKLNFELPTSKLTEGMSPKTNPEQVKTTTNEHDVEWGNKQTELVLYNETECSFQPLVSSGSCSSDENKSALSNSDHKLLPYQAESLRNETCDFLVSLRGEEVHNKEGSQQKSITQPIIDSCLISSAQNLPEQTDSPNQRSPKVDAEGISVAVHHQESYALSAEPELSPFNEKAVYESMSASQLEMTLGKKSKCNFESPKPLINSAVLKIKHVSEELQEQQRMDGRCDLLSQDEADSKHRYSLAFEFHSLRNPIIQRKVSKYYFCSENIASVPFVDPVTVLECDSSGREYTNVSHDITLRIPENAIPQGSKVHFEVATALFGPFKFPKDSRPISPILWICTQEDITFQKPIEVVLPHILNNQFTADDVNRFGLQFHKADHKDFSTRFDGRRHYNFKPFDAKMKFICENNESFGILHTTHCCFLCITAKKKGELSHDMAQKKGYCLSCVECLRSPYSNLPPRDVVYFCTSFFLKTCLQVC